MISAALRLIRWPNLLLLAILQLSIRYALAAPFLEEAHQDFLLSDFEFGILVLSCILIAAGGNIINDIEDIRADRINKPDTKSAVELIGKEQAFNLYLALSFSGVTGGLYLEYICGYTYIGVLQLICAGLLYFYSTSYQCIPLLGNAIVALLGALSALIVILPEPFVKTNAGIMLFMEVLLVFIFFGSLARELVKDCEDEAGDKSVDCGTLAVRAGTTITAWCAASILMLMLAGLAWIQILTYQWESVLPFSYILLFIEMPMVYTVYLLVYSSRSQLDFRKASRFLKFVMFAATLSLVVFRIGIA
ncbi:MAG: UbiA family prenyltransferase [Sphingobacteriales bacterium]|jgi:4-hydroxybenzoate polyprenyltransferase|nr:UbiA family prenyltransferase [Sphingobacteriales bacterium]